MSDKTILVHAALDQGADERMRVAASLARAADAHLVGGAPTAISRFLPPGALAAGGPPVAARCAVLRRDAARALRRFERIARAEAVASAEGRLVEDDAAAALSLLARYADLVVVGRCAPGVVAPPTPADLPATLLLASCRPVLVVPDGGWPTPRGGTVLVAWDGGVPATHALDGALPLLRQAARRVVVRFGPQPSPRALAENAQLAAWFARHGVDHGRLMGAYGHARWREALTDGATAPVLRMAPLPVPLAH